MSLNDFTKKYSYLFWHVKDLDKLSTPAIVEGVLNYGNMAQVEELLAIVGTKKVAEIFSENTQEGRRCNYRPEIKNYFRLYFAKYAGCENKLIEFSVS
jgi:hypothetical protein